jgi:class 3 adenylate cyclase
MTSQDKKLDYLRTLAEDEVTFGPTTRNKIRGTLQNSASHGYFTESAELRKLSEFAAGSITDITTMFCDIRGSTKLSQELSTEKFVKLLDGFFEITVGAIRNREGTVNRFIGDCVFAYWNAPVKHPTPNTSALRAAQGIVAAIKNAGLGLKVSIGIDFGPAFVGVVGPESKQELTALGASVNNAAKIQCLKISTNQHQILVGEASYKRIDAPPKASLTANPHNGVTGSVYQILVE